MKQFLIDFFAWLNEKYNYAVLRNFEELPEGNVSRDIDLLLPAGELKKFRKELPAFAKSHHCRILYTNEDNQFLTIVLVDADFQIFQLDLQRNFAWMGIDLLDEETVLQHRIFNGKVYHLPPALTFLPKYLYSRILGAKYPEKYNAVKDAAFQDKDFDIEAFLQQLSCKRGGFDFWEKTGKWELRLLAFCSAFKVRPGRTLARMYEFLSRYFLDLFRRRGLMISFSGPDGCGKTTVIEMLMERLAVNPPELFHFRPTVLPNLGEAAHKAGVVKEVDRNFDKPHRAKKKGILNSLIRFAYYYTDYVLGYFLKILPLRQRKHIVLFDRYFTDVIVDSERSSIFLNFKFICWMRHFVPMCRYNFIFCVEPETIRSRKQELEVEDMKRIYSRLEYLCARDKRYYKIDNNGTPEDAVRQILDVLAKK